MIFGVALIGYEGRGTSENILIHSLFYLFLVSSIVFFILLIKSLACTKSNPNQN
jgi:hypothetical protein